MKEFPEALTFEDILLVPSYSECLPSEVSTESFFARDVKLHTPLLSASMDTVTENKMAQVMAQIGGLGVIHKNMSIESQMFQVEKVKKYESGMITDPITLSPEKKIKEALALMSKYSISGIPITVNNKLVGILTNRDLRFEENVDQPIENLMTKAPLITAPINTSLKEAKTILQKHRIEKLPVVDKNNILKGLITIKDIEKSETFPHATKDSQGRLMVGAALGVGEHERAEALVQGGVDVLNVDTAHGHSKNVVEMVKFLSQKFPDVIILAGNVVTADGVTALCKAGADVVKVGVGAGSICTTRIVSGVGVPQVSAVIHCAKEAKKQGKSIISDGGIRYSGDVVKVLALGANAVMVGSLLAGSDESPGETVLYQGRTYKIYRGMGSLEAMKKGSRDRYAQSDVEEEKKLVPEGIEGRVPYKGSASAIIYQLAGGVRAGMGYLGAKTIENLQKKSQFVRITPGGLRESHVHDVQITKEAPNYRL